MSNNIKEQGDAGPTLGTSGEGRAQSSAPAEGLRLATDSSRQRPASCVSFPGTRGTHPARIHPTAQSRGERCVYIRSEEEGN